MVAVSRQARDLLLLAEHYSQHMGCAFGRISAFSVGRVGLFDHLQSGGDCMTATAEAALDWFDAHWPVDLCWPREVSRPFKVPGNTSLMLNGFAPGVDRDEASFLVRISHAPVWTSGRRPPWWNNLEVREFLTRAHRQMELVVVRDQGRERFGPGFPSISAIQRYWAKLDELQRNDAQPAVPRPRSPKKKEAA